MLILRSGRDDSGANLGGGGNELGDLVQAVQMRNQLQPQVDLRTREEKRGRNEFSVVSVAAWLLRGEFILYLVSLASI